MQALTNGSIPQVPASFVISSEKITATPNVTLSPSGQFQATDAICIALTLGSPGTRRNINSRTVSVKKRDVQTVEEEPEADTDEDGDADPDVIKVAKVIMDCPELKAVNEKTREIRRYIRSRCLQFRFVKSGCYLVPPRLVKEIDTKINDLLSERKALVELFFDAYPQMVEAMRERLKEHFDAGDYPPIEILRNAFTADVDYLAFTTPGSLKTISKDIFEREHEKARAKFEQSIADIEAMLVKSAAQFVDYMTERLTPSDDPNAPQKMIRESYVVKLRDFFSTLKDRNITGNATLDQLAEQGAAILEGVDIKTLRKSDKARDDIKAKFDALKPILDNAITDKPKRRLKFDLDTDACLN